MADKLWGSIEAGGTKFVCAVGDIDYKLIDKTQFPTTSPQETIQECVDYFKQYDNRIAALSIASFGPIDINKKSKTYGYITSTPKLNWANTNIVGMLQDALEIPIYFTTDVNASAYGEYVSREGIDNLVYYTIGTGIGAGIIQNGNFIEGLSHPEAGHIFVTPHPNDVANEFSGVCPFHKGCLEGMAAGPSLEARTGIRGEHIDLNSDVWDIQAYYIAQSAIQATLMFRPQIIVYGGGVMQQKHMLKRVRRQFEHLLNNYIETPNTDDYIVVPIVSNNGSATVGNFALASR